jgi:glycosyltransferase A (GT-A) superfamily protein (DUF2064 family)
MGAEEQKRIALLIFALTPEAELQNKSLTGEMGLYSLMNQHTLKLAKSLGIPYFHFTEKEQQGNDFGERYTNAVKEIFARGYNGIITIGNDTPGLTINHLRTAYESLVSGSAVLGPSMDGGFYLLAIAKSSFSEEGFLSVSWKSAHVFRQMQASISAKNGDLLVLNPLGDLDTRSDIGFVLDQHINIPIGVKKELIKARLNMEKASGAVNSYASHKFHSLVLNRGSPALAC